MPLELGMIGVGGSVEGSDTKDDHMMGWHGIHEEYTFHLDIMLIGSYGTAGKYPEHTKSKIYFPIISFHVHHSH